MNKEKFSAMKEKIEKEQKKKNDKNKS